MNHKTLLLLNVHLLLYHSIKECDLHIHLVKPATQYWSKRYNGSNRGVPRNRSKRLIIVYSLLLRESLGHESSLIFLDASVSCMLDLVDPFRSHYRLPFRPRDYFLNIILHDGLIFPRNRSKRLIIVYSLLLRESLGHESSLIFLDASVSCMLDLVDPFRSHYRLPFRPRDYFLNIILHNGLIFFHHGIFPYM